MIYFPPVVDISVVVGGGVVVGVDISVVVVVGGDVVVVVGGDVVVVGGGDVVVLGQQVEAFEQRSFKYEADPTLTSRSTLS